MELNVQVIAYDEQNKAAKGGIYCVMNFLVFHADDFHHVVEDDYKINQIGDEHLPKDFGLVFLPVHLEESLDEVGHEDLCVAKAV